MAYNANIPQPGDQLSQSQADILANFQALSPVGNNWILFNQLGAPATTPAATNMAIFAQLSTLTAIEALFVRKQSNGTITEFTSFANTASALLPFGSGWTILPSNILVKWGLAATTGTGAIETISFPVAATIPVFSAAPFFGQVQAVINAGTDQNKFIYLNSISTTQLSVLSVQRTGPVGTAIATQFTYLVFGIPV